MKTSISVQENISNIRELIIPMLRSSDNDMKTLAIKLSDNIFDIELSINTYPSKENDKAIFDQYMEPFVAKLSESEVMTNISEDDLRKLLAVMEYEALAIKDPKQYELASEEEQVEEWVDAMDKQDLQVEAKKLGYRVI